MLHTFTCCCRSDSRNDTSEIPNLNPQEKEFDNNRQTMPQGSISDQWRTQGNAIYITAKPDLPPTVRETRLQKALNLFSKAQETALTDKEIASACKNIGMCTWKMAAVHSIMGSSWYIIKHNFGQALKHLYQSYIKGTACRNSVEWCDNILACIRSCFEDVRDINKQQIPNLNDFQYSLALREFMDYFPVPDIKADCYLEIAQYHFHRGLIGLSVGDYKRCISEMKECHFPLHEALRHGKGIENVESECFVMETDILMQTSLAEAMKSRDTGDQLLEDILLDEETLNIEMIWEIIDWYKDSILKVRDKDIKQEAMSLSRIGKVYDKVLKIKFRARDYLKKSLELAHSITPFDASNEDWYKDCSEILQRYQRDTLQHEQEEHDKKRIGVKEELKDTFKELEKHASDDYKDFLKYIYKTFPPKNPEHKLDLTKKEGDDDFIVKYKALQRAIIHYHPDRVREEEHGLKAKVLNEEITKYLTKRYELVKEAK